MKEEIVAVLRGAAANKEGELCVQAIFLLLDVLKKWAEDAKGSAAFSASGIKPCLMAVMFVMVGFGGEAGGGGGGGGSKLGLMLEPKDGSRPNLRILSIDSLSGKLGTLCFCILWMSAKTTLQHKTLSLPFYLMPSHHCTFQSLVIRLLLPQVSSAFLVPPSETQCPFNTPCTPLPLHHPRGLLCLLTPL